MNNEKSKKEPTEEKKDKIGLKVAGVVLGIIAVIILLAVIFSKTVLPGIMYNNAVKQAEQGNYYEAYNILIKCENYKDSQEKRGEYVLKLGEQHLAVGNIDEAIKCFDVAYSSKSAEASKKAVDYYLNIGLLFLDQENLDYDKAKEYLQRALESTDPAIKAAAEVQLKTLPLNQ